MKFLGLLPLLAVLISTAQAVEKPSAHTKGTPTGKPTGPLKPGEYWWRPQLSPSGPLIVLISVPEQVMNVYRNGILIGRSTVSTGSTGHATPGGVFASGGLLIVQGVGATAGPLIGGLAMSAWDHGLAYTLIAAQILLAVFGVYRSTRRAAPRQMDKGRFVVEPFIQVGTSLESRTGQSGRISR
jgi:hypothetical protein